MRLHMRYFIAFLLTILLTSCEIPADPEDQLVNDKPNNSLPVDDHGHSNDGGSKEPLTRRLYWSQSSLPLKLTTSHELESSYRKVIKEMSEQWEYASSVDLIKTGRVKKNVEYQHLEDYYLKDEDFGIYVTDTPVHGISSLTLAITQIIAEEISKTEQTINYEILHGDIIFNRYNYDFSINQVANTFDFGSVVLHELGHLIGLIDHSQSKESVMYPTIAIEDVVNELYPEDMSRIRSLYNSHNRKNKHELIFPTQDSPSKRKLYKIVIELKVDGTHSEKIIPLSKEHHI